MIEYVECLYTELQSKPLAHFAAFEQGHIPNIKKWRSERISTQICQRAYSGLNVFGIGVDSHVPDGVCSGASGIDVGGAGRWVAADRIDEAAYLLHARGIQNCP